MVDVQADAAFSDETLGTKDKFWLIHDDQWRWLFKYNRAPGGVMTGDDWAEVIAGELAALLGLPHALTGLARRQEPDGRWRRGVTSLDFTRSPPVAPQGHDPDRWIVIGLIHGNQLLYRRDPTYPRHGLRRTSRHTINGVFAALDHFGVHGPNEFMPAPAAAETFVRKPAPFVFTGYLLLDAWIANTDRHHENWAVIEVRDIGDPRYMRLDEEAKRAGFGPVYLLAPSYDHASSLGASLTQTEHLERLTTRDCNRTVAAYLDRGRSRFHDDQAEGRTLSMLQVFTAAAVRHPDAAAYWLNRLSVVRPTDWRLILDRVPNTHITGTTRRFVDALLTETRRRLLDSV